MLIPIPHGRHIQDSFMVETPVASTTLAGHRQLSLIPCRHAASEHTDIHKAFLS